MYTVRRAPWLVHYGYARSVAWKWRRARLHFLHNHLDVQIGKGTVIGPRFDLWIPAPATLHIGPNCEFRRDFTCEISPGGRVEIGHNTIFTAAALIQISTSLTIGSRAIFGQSLMIADGNHRFRDHTKHMMDQGYDFRPITIGDNAFISSKVTILNSIGEGAVIGAGSVVSQPIPRHCVAVGAPARVIEYFGPEDQRPEGLPDGV